MQTEPINKITNELKEYRLKYAYHLTGGDYVTTDS